MSFSSFILKINIYSLLILLGTDFFTRDPASCIPRPFCRAQVHKNKYKFQKILINHFFQVSNPLSAICNNDDYNRSTRLLAATTLRNILGTRNLSEILSDREAIAESIHHLLVSTESHDAVFMMFMMQNTFIILFPLLQSFWMQYFVFASL